MRHYLHNPRRITNAQMARLKTTLAELGDLGGVIVNVETQEIVGGNQRVKAMNAYNAPITITQTFDPPTPQGTVALGYIEHAGERFAYRAVKWTSEQCQRANIVANAAGGSWDWDLLASEFPAELLVSSGLDADALAAMQTDADALGKMLAVEPVAETADAGELELHLAPKRVSLGEIWQLGRHRIACIDSTDEGQVARLLGGAKPTFVWCDPPYGIGLLDTVGKVGHSRNYMPVIGDKNTKTARDAVAKFLPMGGLQVWWGANYYADSFPPSPCWIVFDKDHYGMTFADAELAWVSDNSPARCFRRYR